MLVPLKSELWCYSCSGLALRKLEISSYVVPVYFLFLAAWARLIYHAPSLQQSWIMYHVSCIIGRVTPRKTTLDTYELAHQVRKQQNRRAKFVSSWKVYRWQEWLLSVTPCVFCGNHSIPCTPYLNLVLCELEIPLQVLTHDCMHACMSRQRML
jgi:hypothetical protein